jgi:hypothetical protein
MRLENVRSIGMSIYAVGLHVPADVFIAALKPDVGWSGKEFESTRQPEQTAVDSMAVGFSSSGALRFASVSLLERDYSGADLTAIRKPLDFAERHGFDISALKSILKKMLGIRVLVIGDLIRVPGLN